MNTPLGARQPVATRSANAPTSLIRPCCLRCSKNIAKFPDLTCVKSNNRSVCDRCRSKNKKCDPVSCKFLLLFLILTLSKVPQACVVRLNRLLQAIDACKRLPHPSPEREKAVAALLLRQTAYTSRVEAVVRGQRIPPTIQGMGQAILTSLAQVQSALDGVVDVLRYQVSSLLPRFLPTANSFMGQFATCFSRGS
jgi:hypothetical protein